MTTNELLAKLKWFANEAVCPVNDSCLPGFVAGAYSGWGWARTEITKWLNSVEIEKPSIPSNSLCFFLDGDKWCCVFGDFVNLQESPAAFGDTLAEALDSFKEIERSSIAQFSGGI